jgi:hypothetical protein
MQRLFGVPADLDFNQIRGALRASRVFYYDCLEDTPRDGETSDGFGARTADQRNLIAKIHEAAMTHVRLGTLKQQQQGRRVTQKEVDVTMAVDMLRHGTSQVIDRAVLVTGDLDFRPVVESLVQLGVVVELVYDPLVTAMELQHAADIRRPIDIDLWAQFCSRTFQKNHPMPSRWGGHRRDVWRQLTTGTCAGHPARVWETENKLFTVEIEG